MKNCLLLSLLWTTLALPTLAADNPHALLFGDTHLHTYLSFDSLLKQNSSLGPNSAYRWAKGLPVVHPYTNARVKIDTPLDFLVVSDHAEYMGVANAIRTDNFESDEADIIDRLYASTGAFFLRLALKFDMGGVVYRMLLPESYKGDGADPVKNQTSSIENRAPLGDSSSVITAAWQEVIEAAEYHNAPGEFTSLIGWEWTSTPTGANLHRVIFTPDGATKASQYLPYGSDQSEYPEDLWRWLADVQGRTGSRFVAIPHNSNLSKGFMFPVKTLKNEPITAEYARLRMMWEPVTEVTQIKGDSETHSSVSPNDQFADFEGYEFYLQKDLEEYNPGEGDFARSGLKRGLALAKYIGANPYKFGMIGATDSHTGLASAEEANFWGKMAIDSIPSNKREGTFIGKKGATGWTMSAAGLAAVWARENTREEIYAAFQRKEVYATTGPRIKLRFFAGWKFPSNSLDAEALADIGYAHGVPMGGELSMLPPDGVPQLLIQAARDPIGANLDRIQVVKGWVDRDGQERERVYNVAWSGDRQLDSNGHLPLLASTVDEATGFFDGTSGAPELIVQWQDPDFSSDQFAFYYVRVLQIPTARHSLFDAIALQESLPNDIPAVIQERAYTSPVWYSPAEN